MPIFIRLVIISFFFIAVACHAEELTENAIKNGDFALGTTSWHARYWNKAKIDYLVTEDIKTSTVKVSTGYQLVIPINNKNQSVRIMSEPFKVKKSETFKCEISIRVEGKPKNINVHLLNADHDFKANKTVGSNWETIVLNDKFDAKGINYYRVEISSDGEPATIYIKSAKLLQTVSALSLPIRELSFAAQAVKPLALFENGDDVAYILNSSNPTGISAKIDWTLTNLYGKHIANGKVNISSGITVKRISLGKLPLGWYSVSFTSAENRDNTSEIHNFSVLPRLSERGKIDPEKSFFGTHTEITGDGLLAAKLMGFRWIRLHAPLITKWHAVEEQKGVYSYNDKAIADIKRVGFGIVGTLDRTALWASTGKSDPKTKSSNFYGAYSYLPEEWAAWEKYVASVVKHYKNDIHYWQIWNEPDIPFLVPPEGVSNALAYDRIVRKTGPIAHKNNSDVTLLGGVAYLRQIFFGPGRQVDFIEEMAKLKTADKLDILTFHHYITKQESTKKFESDFDTVKALLKDPKRRYWVTELGLDCSGSNKYEFLNNSSCSSPINAASQIIKFNVMLLAKGVEKIFYYNLFFDTNGLGEFMPGVNVAWDLKEPRPIVSTYAILTWLLDSSSFVSETNKNGLQEYIFKRGTEIIKVVWATSGSTQTYTSTKKATFISMDGSKKSYGFTCRITGEPVYVLY